MTRWDGRRPLLARLAAGEARDYPGGRAGSGAAFAKMVCDPRTACFEATDAAALYEARGEAAYRWEAGRYPRLVPPYPATWWEYAGWADARTRAVRVRTGVFVLAIDLEAAHLRPGAPGVPPSLAVMLRELPEARWFLVALPASQFPGAAFRPPLWSYGLALGEDGALLERGGGPAIVPCPTPVLGELTGAQAARVAAKAASEFHGYMGPVFEALKLLHCRNVDDGGAYNVTRADRAAVERARGAACPGGVVLRTLRVTDGARPRRVGAADRDRAADPEARRLHAVRGSFATYGEAAPLFGRLAGTFWRPAHVRGSAAAGRVAKDYEVGPA